VTSSSYSSSSTRLIYSVSGFTGEVKNLLESSYPDVWIEGEISNFSSPASGHCYFSLKDDKSQVRCALFRQKRLRCATPPGEGKKVLLRGKVSLYQPRGDFQLIVDYMEDAGEGAMRRTMELLKRQLSEEGIFDQEHKLQLPTPPARIGVITSATGAAVRDILATLRKRAIAVPVIIYPALVQGDKAAKAIVEIFNKIKQEPLCDVLILARGGGSLEDLQAFNDESVARAIYQCKIPVVSGVGHETDTTIADFAADARAATPTAAAELISESLLHINNSLQILQTRIQNACLQKLTSHMQSVDLMGSRLRHPQETLNRQKERLAAIEHRLLQTTRGEVARHSHAVSGFKNTLQTHSPLNQLLRHQSNIESLQHRLSQIAKSKLKMIGNSLDSMGKQLQHLNPENIVQRGYAVLTVDDQVVSSIHDTTTGQHLKARLKDGELDVEVK
jgi:exodeoxyribonuclease VII large subunit